MFTLSGIGIGIIEITLYLAICFLIRKYNPQLKDINLIVYCWLVMTVLTGIWEFTFVTLYDHVATMANKLLLSHSHVWTNQYDLSYILPWKLSPIFYSEYGAYADREYMNKGDIWSRLIESTHCLLCGLLSMFCINQKIAKNNGMYLLLMGGAMWSQLMNSILYMGNYFMQMRDQDNVNYNNASFPAGPFLVDRSFMWVNIFWTIMPLFAVLDEIVKQIKRQRKKNKKRQKKMKKQACNMMKGIFHEKLSCLNNNRQI